VRPEQRASLPPGSSLGSITCGACQSLVPMAKFCLECGARLPVRSGVPENPTLPQLPLPLVAREEDLNWLEDRRQRVQGSVVGARLVGEPGAGKTRLLRELLGRARAEGDLTVLTGPDPFYAEVAYYALREAIRKLAQLGPDAIDDRRFEGALPEAHSGLDEVFSGAPARSDTRSPAERRHALAEALRWALVSAARRAGKQRVILAIDDIYRIDGPSRNAFADVIGEPPACSVLLIATHIPGFEAGWGAEAAARVLSGLRPCSSALAAAGRSGPRALSEDAKGVLPMYIEQVLRYAQDGGSDPPSRLADLIALRVDTLEPNARRTLQALSVIGDEMKPETVLELLPKTDNLDGMLSELQRAGMVDLEAGVSRRRTRYCAKSCSAYFRRRHARSCMPRPCAPASGSARRSKLAPSTPTTPETRFRRCSCLSKSPIAQPHAATPRPRCSPCAVAWRLRARKSRAASSMIRCAPC